MPTSSVQPDQPVKPPDSEKRDVDVDSTLAELNKILEHRKCSPEGRNTFATRARQLLAKPATTSEKPLRQFIEIVLDLTALREELRNLANEILTEDAKSFNRGAQLSWKNNFKAIENVFKHSLATLRLASSPKVELLEKKKANVIGYDPEDVPLPCVLLQPKNISLRKTTSNALDDWDDSDDLILSNGNG